MLIFRDATVQHEEHIYTTTSIQLRVPNKAMQAEIMLATMEIAEFDRFGYESRAHEPPEVTGLQEHHYPSRSVNVLYLCKCVFV